MLNYSLYFVFQRTPPPTPGSEQDDSTGSHLGTLEVPSRSADFSSSIENVPCLPPQIARKRLSQCLKKRLSGSAPPLFTDNDFIEALGNLLFGNATQPVAATRSISDKSASFMSMEESSQSQPAPNAAAPVGDLWSPGPPAQCWSVVFARAELNGASGVHLQPLLCLAPSARVTGDTRDNPSSSGGLRHRTISGDGTPSSQGTDAAYPPKESQINTAPCLPTGPCSCRRDFMGAGRSNSAVATWPCYCQDNKSAELQDNDDAKTSCWTREGIRRAPSRGRAAHASFWRHGSWPIGGNSGDTQPPPSRMLRFKIRNHAHDLAAKSVNFSRNSPSSRQQSIMVVVSSDPLLLHELTSEDSSSDDEEAEPFFSVWLQALRGFRHGIVAAATATSSPMTDLRIAHLSQLPGVIGLVRFALDSNRTKLSNKRISSSNILAQLVVASGSSSNYGSTLPQKVAASRSAKAESSNVPRWNICAYLLVAGKAAKLHRSGAFQWTPGSIFIPVVTSFSPLEQFQTLSVAPNFFLFKISDILVSARLPWAARFLQQLKILMDYYARKDRPEGLRLRTLSPLSAQMMLLDRFKFLQLLQEVVATEPLVAPNIYVPRFEPVDAMELRMLKFPLICKPRLAGGPSISHEIGVAFNEVGVRLFEQQLSEEAAIMEAPPTVSVTKIITQEYVEHHYNIILKVFVSGDQHIHIEAQPSLPPFSQLIPVEQGVCVSGTPVVLLSDRVTLPGNSAEYTIQRQWVEVAGAPAPFALFQPAPLEGDSVGLPVVLIRFNSGSLKGGRADEPLSRYPVDSLTDSQPVPLATTRPGPLDSSESPARTQRGGLSSPYQPTESRRRHSFPWSTCKCDGPRAASIPGTPRAPHSGAGRCIPWSDSEARMDNLLQFCGLDEDHFNAIRRLGSALSKRLRCQFLGFDLVINRLPTCKRHKLYVIDLNHLPSYYGVSDLGSWFRDCLNSKP